MVSSSPSDTYDSADIPTWSSSMTDQMRSSPNQISTQSYINSEPHQTGDSPMLANWRSLFSFRSTNFEPVLSPRTHQRLLDIPEDDVNQMYSLNMINDKRNTINAVIVANSSCSSSSRCKSIFSYAMLLIGSIGDQRSVESLQARLTLIELLEHFDFFNDILFILRVAFAVYISRLEKDNNMGLFALWWLGTIWFTSTLCYFLRPWIIYHRIPYRYSSIFWPFVVFAKIKAAGENTPEALYMYERLYWTYALIIRVVEDAPQVAASSIFLLNYGRDAYAIMMICFSVILLIITTVRMGMSYPLAGTISLLLSTQPPVDSPVVSEATHTTYHVTFYMATTLMLWTITHACTLPYVSAPYRVGVTILGGLTGIGSACFLMLWLYYSQQAEIDVDQTFMRGTSQLYPRYEMSPIATEVIASPNPSFALSPPIRPDHHVVARNKTTDEAELNSSNNSSRGNDDDGNDEDYSTHVREGDKGENGYMIITDKNHVNQADDNSNSSRELSGGDTGNATPFQTNDGHE